MLLLAATPAQLNRGARNYGFVLLLLTLQTQMEEGIQGNAGKWKGSRCDRSIRQSKRKGFWIQRNSQVEAGVLA